MVLRAPAAGVDGKLEDLPIGLLSLWELLGFSFLVIILLLGSVIRQSRGQHFSQDDIHEVHDCAISIKEMQDKLAVMEILAYARDQEIRTLQSEIERLERVGIHHGERDAEAKMILGLDPDTDADKKTLKSAYIRTLKTIRPDIGGSETAFRVVRQAFQHLSSRS